MNYEQNKRLSQLLSSVDKNSVGPDKIFLEQLKEKSTAEFIASSIDEVKNTQTKTLIPICRIIMNSKITKIAAAAVIIIGLLFILNNNDSFIDGSSLALGQTIEKMKEMPWMLFTNKIQKSPVEESWLGFKSGVRAFKSNGSMPFMYYNNEKEGVEYTYSPDRYEKDVIYLVKGQDEFYPLEAEQNMPETAFEMTEKIIESVVGINQKVKRKVVNQNGEKVEVITATIASDDSNVEIRRSIGRNLILSTKKDYSKNSNQSDYTCTFSYPADGPKSIYDLGAPKNAQIKDVSIPSEIADLMRKLKTIRQTTLTNYVALSLPTDIKQIPTSFTDSKPEYYFSIKDKLASLIWRRGDEGCLSMGYFSSQNAPPTIASISENIQKASDSFVTVSSSIYKVNEGKVYSYKMVDAKPVQDDYRAIVESLASNIFIELINWPYIMVLRNIPFRWKISSAVGADNEPLIKIERGGFEAAGPGRSMSYTYSWFINPARNYVCQRYEHGLPDEEPREITEITGFAKTADGQWYPHIIKKTINQNAKGQVQQQVISRIIYLQENPEFPKGIFDPNNFPK
jgi:hypothetical protein